MFKHYFQRCTLLVSIVFFGNVFSQTVLNPGDIAILGINTDNPDEFSFVFLTDITAGTQIYFTDSGVQKTGKFRASEGAILYTASNNLNAGTIVNFTEISGEFTNASDSNVGINGFNLSSSGDQIIAFTGSTSNPNFIFALQTNSTQFQSDSNDANQSDLPPGLTIGLTAVAVGTNEGAESEYDNAAYNLSITEGTKTELLTAIADNSNWTGNNTRIESLPKNGALTFFSDKVFLNEIQLNTSGEDWEFFEIQGAPGQNLSNLSLIAIDGNRNSAGTINTVVSLVGQTIPDDGFWVASSPAANSIYGITGNLDIANNTLKNESTTFLLVTDFAGDINMDLDVDNDGILNTTPWSEIIDSVSIIDSDEEDITYSEKIVIGPDGSFLPSGIFRNPDAPTGEFNSTSFLSFSTPDGTPGKSNASIEEIIINGNGIRIDNNDNTPDINDGTDFESVEINSVISKTFTIENNTSKETELLSIEITGDSADSFFLNSNFNSFPKTIPANASLDFDINFSSPNTGVSKAIINVTTTEFTYLFHVAANAVNPLGIILISDVQGNGAISSKEGELVIIEGIVVGDFQDGAQNGTNGDLNGFFVQEEDFDIDSDILTSEGIFIFDGFNPNTNVNVGDLVRVTGTVSEFFGATQITSTTIEVISTNNTLPTAALLNLPVPTTTNSDGEIIPNLEHMEGMLVTCTQSLTVTELFQLDRFGEMRLTQGERPVQYTQQNQPSVAGFSAHLNDIASRTIVLDDGQSIQNPNPIVFPDGNLNSQDALRMGNTISGLTGVVAYSRGSGGSGSENYRIHPTAAPQFSKTNIRPDKPADVGGDLKIAAFNVLNYFTTIDSDNATTAIGSDPRGADSIEEFNRQRQKLLQALIAINADIFGLIEIENDFLAGSSGNAIENLVSELNSILGNGTYAWVNPGKQFVGDDTIAVGIIYKPSIVELSEGTTVEILEDSNLNTLDLSNPMLSSPLPPVFNGARTNRSPLAATFTQLSNDEKLTVVVNHFKSKGSVGAASGDEVINDGKGSSNQTRLNASILVDAWLETDPTNSKDSDFILLGDLNAYARETPITFLEDKGYTDLARYFLGNENAFSFVFDGQIGTLDYALASSSLFNQITGATEWHINADEADAIDYNLDFGRNPAIFDGDSPYRSSDHDPIIVGLNLGSPSLSNQHFDVKDAPLFSPSPFSNHLEIRNLTLQGKVKLLLYDISGKKILEKNFTDTSDINIKTSFLSKGSYLIVVKNDSEIYSKIIIKE